VSELKSRLAATTQLASSRHQLTHPRVAIDYMFPAAAAVVLAGRRDDAMIELRDVDEDSPGWAGVDQHGGWSGDSRQSMTSCDLPLFLTPLTFYESDWQLHYVHLRKIYLLLLLAAVGGGVVDLTPHSMASPAIGHWGTCPPSTSNNFIFSSL